MTPENVIVHEPSVASLLVEPQVNNLRLGSATGFVVWHEGANYLITNRHVVAGRDGLSRKPLHPSAGVPDSIRILHNVRGNLGSWEWRTESLLDEDGKPLWFEHPSLGHQVDAVCLPLADVDGVQLFPYDPWHPGDDLARNPGQFVNIVGFPFGETGGGGLAVWVKGAVATDPGLDWRGFPRFLIDSRTRSGQSGSPVVAYYEGFAMLQGGNVQLGGRPQKRFLGVYSGRINPESDLGIVWKPVVIQEILEATPGR